jgi:hypothetical protein
MFSGDLPFIIGLNLTISLLISTILVVVALAFIMTSNLADDRFLDEAFAMLP